MLKIEVEGTDGAGKTTGLKYFVEQAREMGLNVVETREVGNPHIPACVKLREFVLDPKSNLGGESMELIFAAMRLENDRWLKQLQDSANPPDLVVSDRGWFSHLAYNDHNVSPEHTEKFYLEYVKNATLMPDAVIYFDVNTKTALKRRVKRGEGMDVIEMKGIEFQEKVRESFLSYLYDKSTNTDYSWLFIVDANEDIDVVRRQLDNILQQLEFVK